MPITRKTRPEPADGRFRQGESGNPSGRPTNPDRRRQTAESFVTENADDILKFTFGHAYQNPTICLELARLMFGDNWAQRGASRLLGRLRTIEDCDAAEERVVDAVGYGLLDEAKTERLLAFIDNRRRHFGATSCAEPLGSSNVPLNAELEP